MSDDIYEEVRREAVVIKSDNDARQQEWARVDATFRAATEYANERLSGSHVRLDYQGDEAETQIAIGERMMLKVVIAAGSLVKVPTANAFVSVDKTGLAASVLVDHQVYDKMELQVAEFDSFEAADLVKVLLEAAIGKRRE